MKIYLYCKSNHKYYINKFLNQFNSFNKKLQNIYYLTSKNKISKNFYNVKIARLPYKNRRFTVLKSPHVNKTAREQFELREHKCIITLTINESLKNHQKFLNFLFQWIEFNHLGLSITYKIKNYVNN